MIVMLADLAIAEHESGLNIVDHRAPGLTEQIGRHPMCSARPIIGTHLIEDHREIFRLGSQHAPHVAYLRPAQFTKCRVTKQHVIGITGTHRLGIQLRKRLIKAGDQCAVGLTLFLVVHACTSLGELSVHDKRRR
ncbi:hypothetical protein ALP03_02006 [Pseudomonas amygdali pv. tabaci]|uniref:Uncharacterized protein n=1 Tax=Pseudomonas amygdali pv. tabaci TaxID=322 RepID=A0A3M6G2T5_PSEAJ|nr:hypothetical protein ALP03_02006 [Pseudomonas amygdali pv. tabaci]